MYFFNPVLLLAYGFLAGSIPTGYLTVRALKGWDIRTRGSGNPGTANVYRCAGWKAGLVTLTVDALKGWAPAALAHSLRPDLPELAAAVGGFAVAGHVWTPFLGFKGGKGVATAAGVFLALMPLPLAVAAAAFLSGAKVSGHVAVGSLLGALVMPFAAALFHAPSSYVSAAAVISALIVYKHVPNIQRLRQNRELGIHGPSA